MSSGEQQQAQAQAAAIQVAEGNPCLTRPSRATKQTERNPRPPNSSAR